MVSSRVPLLSVSSKNAFTFNFYLYVCPAKTKLKKLVIQVERLRVGIVHLTLEVRVQAKQAKIACATSIYIFYENYTVDEKLQCNFVICS